MGLRGGRRAGTELTLIVRYFAILFAFLLSACSASAQNTCSNSIVDLRDGDVQVRFRVEVAKTARERARGLMDRETMARSRGMLFVYEAPHRASFWMKNTIIPLDILFLDETGRVRTIAKNTVPYSLDPILGGDGIKYVLEINAGLSSKFRLSEGAVLRHPEIDQDVAAWKCAEAE